MVDIDSLTYNHWMMMEERARVREGADLIATELTRYATRIGTPEYADHVLLRECNLSVALQVVAAWVRSLLSTVAIADAQPPAAEPAKAAAAAAKAAATAD